MAGGIRLIIDGAEMHRLLQGAQGPVVGHLIRVGDGIIAAARQDLESHNKTEALSRSIVKRFVMTPAGPMLLIVAGAGLRDPNYAWWVHEGNAPAGSRIFPKNKSVLAWVTSGERPTSPEGWRAARQAGTAVFARSVMASRPVKYLTRHMELARVIR